MVGAAGARAARKGACGLARPFKLAWLGGVAGDVAAMADGLVWGMAQGTAAPFAVDLALADVAAGASGTAAEHALRIGTRAGLSLTACAAATEEALDGADLVLCADRSTSARRRLSQVYAAVGWAPPACGSGVVGEGCAAGASFLESARAAAARCPAAPLVTLAPPVDVLAGAARRCFGITGLRAVGLSPEVEILRGRLAALLTTPERQILLVHGGVDRVGWVVRFAAGGRDGYGDFGDRLQAMGADPCLSASDRLILDIYGLTAMIRTSARQAWPFDVPGVPESGGCDPDALPASDPPLAPAAAVAAPPDGTGTARTIGRLVCAMATGERDVVALQVPYAGDALAWSPEITVEVPVVVGGPHMEPMAVGPLPAGVDGLPRLLGQQRALASDYLAAPEVAVLRRALAATPLWGRADQIRALADALHAAFAPGLEAAGRGR